MTRALTLALTLALLLVSLAFVGGAPSAGTAGAWQRISPKDDLATRIAEPRGTEESDAADERAPGGGEAEAGSLVDLAESLLETEPDFGPESGELEITDETGGFFDLPNQYQDFLLTVTFVNGERRGDRYDFGAMFRFAGSLANPHMIAISVDTDGFWVFAEGTLEEWEAAAPTIIDTGVYRDLDETSSGENSLTILAQGDQVLVMVNGDELTTGTVSYEDEGFISVVAGLSSGGDGDVLEFTDLKLWEID